ncbi:hypothetical protein M409DRAFT_28778 [Zasmidium cellare ATCC 36951]|uniref:Uncharacterized protein n=1 Tax=Zasmidium cellare ATCC 36951 TaxID=1080233 RepID=A0A6A6C3N2_ZASCE|nr:uncharacterized protein M409DRAFT_28778 [Zasmidium cellare ATCC 36951]KAF2160898.1 hypothetical protein M409DRAFT_28778 [Zasmidium cellare ATCC 36951]
MKLTTVFAVILPIAHIATAKITGFMAPSTIGAGDKVKIVITTSFNGTSVTEVAQTFGIANGNAGNPEGKGQTLSAKFLGFDNSNINNNINHYINIPADWPQGSADIASVLFEITTAPGSPNVPLNIFRNFKLPVTVGPLNSTNADYRMSMEFTPPASNFTGRLG